MCSLVFYFDCLVAFNLTATGLSILEVTRRGIHARWSHLITCLLIVDVDSMGRLLLFAILAT